MGTSDVKIGMLLDTDKCTGCFGCQTACREVNRYSYDEQWMQVIRRDPYFVGGKLRMYHLVAPSLDKCAPCYANDNNPLCCKGCPGGALKVGPVEELIPLMEGADKVLFV